MHSMRYLVFYLVKVKLNAYYINCSNYTIHCALKHGIDNAFNMSFIILIMEKPQPFGRGFRSFLGFHDFLPRAAHLCSIRLSRESNILQYSDQYPYSNNNNSQFSLKKECFLDLLLHNIICRNSHILKHSVNKPEAP